MIAPDLDQVLDGGEPLGRDHDLAQGRGAAAHPRDRRHRQRHRRGWPAQREHATQAARERHQLGRHLDLHHPALDHLGVVDLRDRVVERGRQRGHAARRVGADGCDLVGVEAGEPREHRVHAAQLAIQHAIAVLELQERHIATRSCSWRNAHHGRRSARPTWAACARAAAMPSSATPAWPAGARGLRHVVVASARGVGDPGQPLDRPSEELLGDRMVAQAIPGPGELLHDGRELLHARGGVVEQRLHRVAIERGARAATPRRLGREHVQVRDRDRASGGLEAGAVAPLDQVRDRLLEVVIAEAAREILADALGVDDISDRALRHAARGARARYRTGRGQERHCATGG